MLNYLWAGMIFVGILFGAFNGKMLEITNAALDSSKEAVTLCITMAGVMSFWVGLMEIAERSGVLDTAAKKLHPLIRFLFPSLPKDHPAVSAITANFIANFLGLGWAATPAGLQAMKHLANLEEERRKSAFSSSLSVSDSPKPSKSSWFPRASVLPRSATSSTHSVSSGIGPARPVGVAGNEMCTFLILNISSLQLIPMHVIAYRSQYGSVNPAAIVGAGILSTAVSTGAAVLFCKCMDRSRIP